MSSPGQHSTDGGELVDEKPKAAADDVAGEEVNVHGNLSIAVHSSGM